MFPLTHVQNNGTDQIPTVLKKNVLISIHPSKQKIGLISLQDTCHKGCCHSHWKNRISPHVVRKLFSIVSTIINQFSYYTWSTRSIWYMPPTYQNRRFESPQTDRSRITWVSHSVRRYIDVCWKKNKLKTDKIGFLHYVVNIESKVYIYISS